MSFQTGAGFRQVKCGGADWDGLRGGCGLEVCGARAGKISQTPAGARRVSILREQTTNFNLRRTIVLETWQHYKN